MLLEHSLGKILEKYDFTESIITNIQWENDLFDLSLTLDYWWNLDWDKDSTQGYGRHTLKLTFIDCIQVSIVQDKKLITMNKKEIHPPSWFTIVGFRALSCNISDGTINLEITTTDYANPWLTVLCRDIRLELLGE